MDPVSRRNMLAFSAAGAVAGPDRCGRQPDGTCDAPSITVEMAKGFTLYMVKAIINGRTDEIVDLAKTNLWR